MPRGGSRPGSGRKPKDAQLAALHGSRQRSVVPFPPAAVESGPAPTVKPPAGLPAGARAVWKREAPYALAAGTLVAATADAFALHCRNVVLELKLSKGADAGGASHRGMIAAVTAGRVRFVTSPNGKPIAAPAKARDLSPLEKLQAQAKSMRGSRPA